MIKYSFLIFLLCGLIVTIIGVFFLINNQSEWFRLDGEGPLEHRKYGGLEIIIMGVSMMLLGLFLKWKLSMEKADRNSETKFFKQEKIENENKRY
jgi:hypothetical protein